MVQMVEMVALDFEFVSLNGVLLIMVKVLARVQEWRHM